MKNCVIWTRVSTKYQEDNGGSLSDQKNKCELFARQNGYVIKGYFGGTHESAKVRRIGESKETPVDIRIVSATHKDLAKEVEAGRFRQDLYYRLNVVSITMPSLRELRDDLPMLIEHLLAKNPMGEGLCYTKFINTMKQESVVEQLLPLSNEQMQAEKTGASWEYIYESSWPQTRIPRVKPRRCTFPGCFGPWRSR